MAKAKGSTGAGTVTVHCSVKPSPVQYNSFEFGAALTLPMQAGESVDSALNRANKELDSWFSRHVGDEGEKMISHIAKAIEAGRKMGR